LAEERYEYIINGRAQSEIQQYMSTDHSADEYNMVGGSVFLTAAKSVLILTMAARCVELNGTLSIVQTDGSVVLKAVLL